MVQEDRCIILANRIADILGRGLSLSDDVLHYIDSTFGNPCLKEIEAIIEDPSNALN